MAFEKQKRVTVPWFNLNYKRVTHQDSFWDYLPVINHLRLGKERKGISDLWNIILLIFSQWHANKDIRDITDYLNRIEKTSREYYDKSRKLKQFKELRYYHLLIFLINYLNSVMDVKNSAEDNSFLGIYYAYNAFNHKSYCESPNGYEPFQATRGGTYWGLRFGYQNRFEYYADMVFPTVIASTVTIFNITWYTDFVIPYKNIKFYLGLGFNQIEYHDDPKKISAGGCGLGFHPRIGISYLLNKNHYFRFNIIPYLIWGNVKCSDPEGSRLPGKNRDYERTIGRSFGDNFGLQFLYSLKISSHLYLKINLIYSKVTEPGGLFTENNIKMQLNERNSYMRSFDLSLNYVF